MEFIKVKLSDLKPAEYNPRKQVKQGSKLYKSIEKSINEFGYADPIIVNDDLTVIGGHQRLIVLQDMGVESENVIKLKLDKNKEKALNLALNKISGFWEEDKLKEVFSDLEGKIDWDVTGFTENEIKKYLGTQELEEIESNQIEKREIKIGDMFLLGEHILLCGDCTNESHVKKLLCDNKIDALITDPPYGVNYSDKTKSLRTALNRGRNFDEGFIENDNLENYSEFFYNFLKLIPFNDTNSCYIFMSTTKLYDLHSAFIKAGGTWGDYLIWLKQHAIMSRKDYNPKHEYIFYGWFGKHKFHGPLNACAVLEFDHAMVNPIHPHQKPLDLIGRLIDDATAIEQNVYDPFGGSGTTLIACAQMSRKCFMMELDPNKCNDIINRAVANGLDVIQDGR